MPEETTTGPPLPPKPERSDNDMDISISDQVLNLSRQVQGHEEIQKEILKTLRELKDQVRTPTDPPTPSFTFPPLRPATFPLPEQPPRTRPKAATPESFDGDRSKGRAFITSCLLYFSLRQSEFTSDQDQIKWVLSYMKSGRAALFAQRTMRAETLLNRPAYASFEAFLQTLEEEFTPEDEATHALVKLTSDEYFQGSKTVDTYIDEFRELVDEAGLFDQAAMVMYFRRGLNPAIQ